MRSGGRGPVSRFDATEALGRAMGRADVIADRFPDDLGAILTTILLNNGIDLCVDQAYAMFAAKRERMGDDEVTCLIAAGMPLAQALGSTYTVGLLEGICLGLLLADEVDRDRSGSPASGPDHA